jgi:hypothetical protein
MSGTVFWKPPGPESDIDTAPANPRFPLDLPVTPFPFAKERQRRGRWALGLLAGLIVFHVGGIVYDFWSRGANAGSVAIAIIVGALALFFLGMFVWGYRALRRPDVVGVRVAPTEVVGQLSDGRVEKYSIRDHRLKLRLLSLNAPGTNEGYLGLDVILSFGDGAAGLLSHEDARQLLWALRTAGLEIAKKKDWVKYAGPATNFLATAPPWI